MLNNCERCGVGYLVDKMKERQETYLGVRGYINWYYSECNYCLGESQSGWQLTVNRDNHLYYHRVVEGKTCIQIPE